MNNKIFILGCERSGSTWLTNIFDAHQNTTTYMEPLVENAKIFSEMPSRNVYMAKGNRFFIECLKKRFEDVENYKYLVKVNIVNERNAIVFNRFLGSAYAKMAKMLPFAPNLRYIRYFELNQNRSKLPYRMLPKEKKCPNFDVYKELRLNFKINLLRGIYENAKCIIMIRNPLAQIDSVLRLFKNGYLKELEKSLSSFCEIIEQNVKFFEYTEVLRLRDRSLIHKLALWWVINYNTLIKDVKANQMDYRICYYEDLAADTFVVATEIFNWCGLNIEAQVEKFINRSTTKQSKMIVALDTIRNSKEYYKARLENVDPRISTALETVSKTVSIEKEIIDQYF